MQYLGVSTGDDVLAMTGRVQFHYGRTYARPC